MEKIDIAISILEKKMEREKKQTKRISKNYQKSLNMMMNK